MLRQPFALNKEGVIVAIDYDAQSLGSFNSKFNWGIKKVTISGSKRRALSK